MAWFSLTDCLNFTAGDRRLTLGAGGGGGGFGGVLGGGVVGDDGRMVGGGWVEVIVFWRGCGW